MKTREVAAVTMVYGRAFLEKWIDHYSGQIGRENLFVISHGPDEFHREACVGANNIVIPRSFDRNFETSRIRLINNFANGLLQAYEAVIFSDVDELIAVDPGVGANLAEYVLQSDHPVSCPIGLNVVPVSVGQRIDWHTPILQQAPIALYSPGFCKPVIRRAPCELGEGGHTVFDIRFTVDPNLILFHLKFVDASLASRYDSLIEEIDAVYEGTNVTTGVVQWKRDREKVLNFAMHYRSAGHRCMTPHENTRDALAVARVGETRRFGVVADQRTEPFLLPERYRQML